MNTYPLPQDVLDAQTELNGVRAEYQAVSNRLKPIAEKFRDKFSKFALDTLNAADDKLAVILSPQFYDVSVDFLRASEKFMYEKYGTHTSGYNGLTYQSLPQLTFIKGNDEHNAKLRRLIEDALPHMIPFSEDMKDVYGHAIDKEVVGFCLFGILEAGLSYHEKISVYFSHDKKVLVSSTRYSRTTYTKVMDFDEGIDYLITNHYYESSDSSDSDED